jgi:hypothetical protein
LGNLVIFSRQPPAINSQPLGVFAPPEFFIFSKFTQLPDYKITKILFEVLLLDDSSMM